MSTPKLCIDCRWFDGGYMPRCLAPQNPKTVTDLITGELHARFTYCVTLRDGSAAVDNCGDTGSWWEAKDLPAEEKGNGVLEVAQQPAAVEPKGASPVGSAVTPHDPYDPSQASPETQIGLIEYYDRHDRLGESTGD